MTTHLNIADGVCPLRHMAGDAFTAGASRCVLGVLLDRCSVRSGLPVGAVASEAEAITRLAHHSRIFGAMRIVATEAGHAARIHEAADKIVTLHAVLVCRTVREMSERSFAELVFLELPEVRQVQANVKANGPVIISST